MKDPCFLENKYFSSLTYYPLNVMLVLPFDFLFKFCIHISDASGFNIGISLKCYTGCIYLYLLILDKNHRKKPKNSSTSWDWCMSLYIDINFRMPLTTLCSPSSFKICLLSQYFPGTYFTEYKIHFQRHHLAWWMEN